jgi:hypothetical protein
MTCYACAEKGFGDEQPDGDDFNAARALRGRSYGVELTVTGLASEQQAEAAMQNAKSEPTAPLLAQVGSTDGLAGYPRTPTETRT